MPYRVIRDTREQDGWTFPAKAPCLGTVSGTLKTGDYTLEGFEKDFVVERKRSTGEVAQNVFQPRFERELVRLEEFTHPFLVCEFAFEDIVTFPFNSGIPKSKWRFLKISPQLLLKKINEFQVKYKTTWVFAGGRGREFCSSLFKRIVENA